MASILDSHLADIPVLCRRYGVTRLELFGSAATEAFDPERSDLDFLVEFDDDSYGLFDRYFGLKEALEALYGRPVDLVSAGPSGIPISSTRSTSRGNSSMRPKTPKLLEDIRDAAAYIREIARDRTVEDYQRDRMLRQTIERNFEIIGEAVNRLVQHDPEPRGAFASIGRSSISATC